MAAAQLSSNNERASRFPVPPIKRPSFLVDKHTGGVGGILCMQQPSSHRDAHPSVANPHRVPARDAVQQVLSGPGHRRALVATVP